MVVAVWMVSVLRVKIPVAPASSMMVVSWPFTVLESSASDTVRVPTFTPEAVLWGTLNV